MRRPFTNRDEKRMMGFGFGGKEVIRVSECRCPKCGQSIRKERAHSLCERCGIVETSREALANTIEESPSTREALEALKLAHSN